MANLIEKFQKKVIFEEAARRGIMGSTLLQLPQILKDIIGTSDIGLSQYGAPMAPVYKAVENQLISVDRMSNFFTGLTRDLTVTDLAASEVEGSLVLMNLELWSRMQMTKNRAMDLAKRANAEKLRAVNGSTWLFTESFSTTNNLDMSKTSAWIDTAEGVAFLPSAGTEKIIKPSEVRVTSQVVPLGADLLGSTASMAFDGLQSTNWRCMFVDNQPVVCEVELDGTEYINAISIDPVGFGINISVELDSGKGYNSAIKDVIYNKTTFQVDNAEVNRIRVSFYPEGHVLPKVCGIREMTLYTAMPALTADVYSKVFNPSMYNTQIRIDLKAQLPTNTKVTPFFSLDGTNWTKIPSNSWYSISSDSSTDLQINPIEASEDSVFRGLYGISLAGKSNSPLTTADGKLNVGMNQVEVVAFRHDWRAESESPRILSPSDFTGKTSIRTWSNVVPQSINPGQLVLQKSTQTSVIDSPQLQAGGSCLLFERPAPTIFDGTTDGTYKHLNLIPLNGSAAQPLQSGYNYRMRYYVYCPKQFNYGDAKYWFMQGYRQVGTKSYSEIGKSFASFSMYVNDTLVIGDNQPATIYATGSDDALFGSLTVSQIGKSFSIFMQEGWNKVDVYMNVVSPSDYGTDSFDSTYPYVQLSMTPSLFDLDFRTSSDHPITMIVGSGTFKPVSEFDLLWNLPQQPMYWAWSQDRSSILFNSKYTQSIDGVFSGVTPDCLLNFRSLDPQSANDLYVRLQLERAISSTNSPMVTEYTVMVK